MPNKINKICREVEGVVVGAYMVAVVLFGLWSMMNHIHWAVPFVLVGAAVVTQNLFLVGFNILAAAGLAVYGLMTACQLTWFKASLALALPLVVFTVVGSVLYKLTRPPEASQP